MSRGPTPPTRATPSCAAGRERCASATPTAPPSTSRTAPTSTPPRPSTACWPSCATTANPSASASAATGSASACGSPGTPRAPSTTDPVALRGLRTELDRRGLEVVTLNGFPYEGFGAEEVKYRVYKPDWADPERLAHTADLARLLAALLPDDVTEGTISTLPLAWRTAIDPARRRRRVRRAHHPRRAARRPGGADRPLHPHRPRTRAGLHRRDDRRRDRPAHGRGPRPHRRLRRHLPSRHLLRGPGHRARRPRRRRDPRRQVPALRGPARRAPRKGRSPRGARRVRRTPLPAPDPHPHPRRAARHRRPRRGARRRRAPRHARPGAPTSTYRCTRRPPPPSPPRSRCSRPRSPRLVGGAHPLTRHLEVETYTWQALPPEVRPRGRTQLADGIAAELTLARDLLTDLGLKELP